LDIIRVDKDKFAEFGVPVPSKRDPAYVCEADVSVMTSALGNHDKEFNKPYLVLHMNPFLQHMIRWCSEVKVEFMFNTAFTGFIRDNRGKIVGALLKKANGEQVMVYCRLVADASGVTSAGRKRLTTDSFVDNEPIVPKDLFHIYMRYLTLSEEYDNIALTSWPYFKTWTGPARNENETIIGVGANISYDYAAKVWDKFVAVCGKQLPKGEQALLQKGVIPYRRPPFSLVDHGFVALGDSACITKPFALEGIGAHWKLSQIAAEEAGAMMQMGAVVTEYDLWNINKRYFNTQGADFAELYTLASNLIYSNFEENDFMFSKDIAFSADILGKVAKDYAFNLSAKEKLTLLWRELMGVVTGKISSGTFTAFMNGFMTGAALKKHYKKFPSSPSEFPKWKGKAEILWTKARNMADNSVHGSGIKIES
jgi:flavin-dependent dehydrogenase